MTKARGARPTGSLEQIKQRGGDALALADETRAALDQRLPAGLIDGLRADLASISGVVPSAIAARVERKAATGGERASAKITAAHVASIRASIADAFPRQKDVHKAWGVGSKLDAGTTKTVLAAGNVVLGRAASHPEEARAAGILADDIALLTQQLTTLQGADEGQGTKQRAAKDATATQNATLVRIQSAVATIGVRGKQAFLTEAATRVRFEKLLLPYAKTKKAKKATKVAAGATS